MSKTIGLFSLVVSCFLVGGCAPNLFFAAKANDVKLIKKDLANHQSPDATGPYNRTPLWEAAYLGHYEAVQALLDGGANPDIAESHHHQTPLILATRGGRVKENNYAVAHALLNAKANPNLQDDDGYTALHYAVESGQTDIIRDLVAHGADPKIIGHDGMSPEGIAVSRNSPEVLAAIHGGR